MTSGGVLVSSVIANSGGKSPLTYKQFQNVLLAMPPPASPVPALTVTSLGESYTPVSDDHDAMYGVPTLEELGEAHWLVAVGTPCRVLC